MKFRTLLPCALLFPLVGIVGTAPAAAQQYACNGSPGERQIGVAPGGHGIAPTPLCVRDRPAAPAAPPPEHPADTLARSAALRSQAMMGLLREMHKMQGNPDLMAYQNGGLWKYPSVPGQCRAVFLSPEGVFAVYGPARDFDGVAIMFQSIATKKPTKPKQISVEFEERNLDTGKIQRIPMQALDDTNSVTMIYKGNFFPQVIDSIVDKARYRVLLKNKPIVEMDLRHGLQAKARLRACSSGKR